MNSVLITIKKLLGYGSDPTEFDPEIIVHINSVLMDLSQLGVGPEDPASISSELDTWEQTIGNINDYKAVETYMYLRDKLLFDPPPSSAVVAEFAKQIEKLEWRLNAQAELKKGGM